MPGGLHAALILAKSVHNHRRDGIIDARKALKGSHEMAGESAKYANALDKAR